MSWSIDASASLAQLVVQKPDQAMLGKLLDDQRKFFEYMSAFRPQTVLVASYIATNKDWQSMTAPGKFRFRPKTLKPVDSALAQYHQCVDKATYLLRQCRMFCKETSTASAASQINFAFPGFDSQVFDVGNLAVVTPWLFFSGTGCDLMFKEADWSGAISSHSVAKELMQASPDVSRLYEEDKGALAKQIMARAQKQILHNIAVAAYLRSEGVGEVNAAATGGFAANDRITWPDVLTRLDKSRNEATLASFAHVSFTYNPSRSRVQAVFRNLKSIEDANGDSHISNPDGDDHMLVDVLHFLQLLCELVRLRTEALATLRDSLVSLSDDVTKGKTGEPLLLLQAAMGEEYDSLQACTEFLPTFTDIQAQIAMANKSAAKTNLGTFLARRVDSSYLQKKGILTSPDLAEVKEERNSVKAKLRELAALHNKSGRRARVQSYSRGSSRSRRRGSDNESDYSPSASMSMEHDSPRHSAPLLPMVGAGSGGGASIVISPVDGDSPHMRSGLRSLHISSHDSGASNADTPKSTVSSIPPPPANEDDDEAPPPPPSLPATPTPLTVKVPRAMQIRAAKPPAGSPAAVRAEKELQAKKFAPSDYSNETFNWIDSAPPPEEPPSDDEGGATPKPLGSYTPQLGGLGEDDLGPPPVEDDVDVPAPSIDDMPPPPLDDDDLPPPPPA